MSYILDALKRAEQQRGGPARGASSLPRAMASDFAPRARWPWIVGGLGGLAVLVIATLAFWPARQPAATDATPAAIVAGSPPAPAAVVTAPRVEPAPPAPIPPAPRAEPAPAAGPAPAPPETARSAVPPSLSEAARAAAPPAAPPVPRAAQSRPAESRPIESRAAESRGAAPGVVEPRAAAPRAPAPSAVSRPTPPAATSGGTTGRGAAAITAERPTPPSPQVARVAPSRAPAPEPPAAAGAAPSGELKALAAKLSIQVLSWAPERKDRFVFLNGHRYGEGQTVEDKIVVEQINEDSVVLAYQGERMILKGR